MRASPSRSRSLLLSTRRSTSDEPRAAPGCWIWHFLHAFRRPRRYAAGVDVDPAARSVRIAVALSERFAELLKGPSTVTVRKKSGAMFGLSGNQDEMSLRIGEAQQLYPEIWRHLDDARAAFAARGLDVSGYDL